MFAVVRSTSQPHCPLYWAAGGGNSWTANREYARTFRSRWEARQAIEDTFGGFATHRVVRLEQQ